MTLFKITFLKEISSDNDWNEAVYKFIWNGRPWGVCEKYVKMIISLWMRLGYIETPEGKDKVERRYIGECYAN